MRYQHVIAAATVGVAASLAMATPAVAGGGACAGVAVQNCAAGATIPSSGGGGHSGGGGGGSYTPPSTDGSANVTPTGSDSSGAAVEPPPDPSTLPDFGKGAGCTQAGIPTDGGKNVVCATPEPGDPAPAGPGRPAAPPKVDPAVLAQQLVARIQLKPIDIGIVPEEGANRMGLVGLPTWMWVNNPTPNTYGPITDSATAGGVTVRITANVDRVEWDMGDGTPAVVCGLGTPYADHYGKQDSPSCGHRYEHTSGDQPGNAYTVTATAHWVVQWQAGAQRGTITPPPVQATGKIRVGELQVLQR